MSDNADCVNLELLICGCYREGKVESALHIAAEVVSVIAKYCESSMIIGIGAGYCFPATKEWTRFKKWESVVADPHSVFVNDNGMFVVDTENKLHSIGRNRFYRLGVEFVHDSMHEQLTDFVPIPLETNKQRLICSICTFEASATFIYLVDDNRLYGNGKNDVYDWVEVRMGINNPKPALFKNGTLSEVKPFWSAADRIQRIACCDEYSLFLMQSGDVFVHGRYDGKSISEPTVIHRQIKQIAAGMDLHVAITVKNGVEFGMFRNSSHYIEPTLIKQHLADNQILVTSAECGSNHVCMLTVDKQCYTVGRNDYGQCGTDKSRKIESPHKLVLNAKDDTEFVVDVTCGHDHTYCVSNKNNLFVFGYNYQRQCSALIQDETIKTPHLVDKEQELGLSPTQRIVKAMAFSYAGIVFVDSTFVHD